MFRLILASLVCILTIGMADVKDDEDGSLPSIGLAVISMEDARKLLEDKKLKMSPPPREGVFVARVRRYFPADTAGIQFGDIVTAFGGKPVKSVDDYLKLTKEARIGQKYSMRVYRMQEVQNRIIWKPITLTCQPVSRKDACLAALRQEKDEIQDLVFYYHRDSAEFVNERTDFIVYFVYEKGKPQGLRMQLQYVADSWLFINRYIIKADDNILTVQPRVLGASEVKRDLGIIRSVARIWEWCDAPVSKDQIQTIADAKQVIVRFEGRQYVHDKKLTHEELDRIRVVLMAYKYLGGT